MLTRRMPTFAAALRVAVEAIEGAPHEDGCDYEYTDDVEIECTCWKSRAIADIESKLTNQLT